MPHRFPAGKERQLSAAIGVGSQNIRKKASRFSGFAVQMIRQQNRFITQFLRQFPGCMAKLPDAADDLGGNVRQLFRRFPVQQRKRPLTERQIVFFHNVQCVCAGGAVRGCRTGGDHIRRVAQNIGKHNDLHMGGGAPLGKSPALDGRQPLADGIYLHDVRPAGQKPVRDGL